MRWLILILVVSIIGYGYCLTLAPPFAETTGIITNVSITKSSFNPPLTTVVLQDGRVISKWRTLPGLRTGIPVRLTWTLRHDAGMTTYNDYWWCAEPVDEEMRVNDALESRPLTRADARRRLDHAKREAGIKSRGCRLWN